ncbi:hypothetical protein [Moorena sp. SIO3F7]|uniref:hypothetical protein n=1 Tax=Moorena sp. SIO3F7 TaxID=2607839 RepID=UPI0013FEB291|nr:hypothetical protein [Moorena sp. SIO3F7]NEQ04424.1 hypothetical protein [Moorena sp. SIO3F7]
MGEPGVIRLNYLRFRPSGHYAQSKQRRMQRWLYNARINVHRLYKPHYQSANADWKQECLYLSLDTSLLSG